MSQKVETTINKMSVTLITVERGERIKDIRTANGIAIGPNVSYIDVTEDFDYDYPAAFEALKNAGVTLNNVTTVIEVRK